MINQAQIIRDISLFSDPATQVSTDSSSAVLRVDLKRNDEDRRYLFDVETGRVQAQHNDKRFSSLASLLASEEFADLRRFSATQRRTLASKGLESLLEPHGQLEVEGALEPIDIERGRTAFAPKQSETLQVLLIDGSAGVGKTSFIERMVYERAGDAALPPIFHVTSKGRRLSNLADAIGKTANDADARFRAEQVPVLARLGALQIAIDGFDELVQPDGYQNAWGALRDLVREIGSGGPLILAGRDTFFDQQEILRRFKDLGNLVNLSLARLQEVTESAATKWLSQKGWSEEALSRQEFQEFIKREYPRRPFFLSQIAGLGSFDNLAAEEGSPQQILTSELLKREADILTPGLPGVSHVEIVDGLNEVCEEIAVEMAERESDSTTVSYVEFTSEMVFANKIPEEYLSAFVRRAGSIALFTPSEEQRGQLQFPHSEIQNSFLAKAILRSIEKSSVPSTLRTTLMGADAVEAFADVFRSLSAQQALDTLERIRVFRETDRFNARLSANLAALALACLVRGDGGLFLRLTDADISEARLFGTLCSGEIVRCQINSLDIRGADASAINFSDVQIQSLVVDATTRLSAQLPTVFTLQVDEGGSVSALRNPEEINRWLEEHSPLAEQAEIWQEHTDLPLVRLFDRVCRRFMRQYLIRDNDQDEGSFLLHDPLWPSIQECLGDRLSIFRRAAQGSQDWYYQLREPELLLNPEHDDASKSIRSAIVRKALELAQ